MQPFVSCPGGPVTRLASAPCLSAHAALAPAVVAGDVLPSASGDLGPPRSRRGFETASALAPFGGRPHPGGAAGALGRRQGPGAADLPPHPPMAATGRAPCVAFHRDLGSSLPRPENFGRRGLGICLVGRENDPDVFFSFLEMLKTAKTHGKCEAHRKCDKN